MFSPWNLWRILRLIFETSFSPKPLNKSNIEILYIFCSMFILVEIASLLFAFTSMTFLQLFTVKTYSGSRWECCWVPWRHLAETSIKLKFFPSHTFPSGRVLSLFCKTRFYKDRSTFIVPGQQPKGVRKSVCKDKHGWERMRV